MGAIITDVKPGPRLVGSAAQPGPSQAPVELCPSLTHRATLYAVTNHLTGRSQEREGLPWLTVGRDHPITRGKLGNRKPPITSHLQSGSREPVNRKQNQAVKPQGPFTQCGSTSYGFNLPKLYQPETTCSHMSTWRTFDILRSRRGQPASEGPLAQPGKEPASPSRDGGSLCSAVRGEGTHPSQDRRPTVSDLLPPLHSLG